ncbi:MAG: PAS domain S-box protein [Deltaproteobacteria bacterium]|nr:PAS domain S-box protein [Deltaproteobacteria bacterium]
MKVKDKTREQLTEELDELRRRVAELEAIQAKHLAVERVLQETEEEKRAILDSLVEHVVYHDLDLTVLWANRAACDSVSMTREDLVGRHCYEIWGRGTKICEDCPVQLARQTGQPQAIEKTTPDGRSWYIQGSPVLDSNGHLMGMVELTLDISQRKRTEEELRASEYRHRHLVEAMNEGLGFADRNYNFTFVNQKFCDMLGYSRDEMLGHQLINFVHNESKEIMKDQMARRKKGETERFEIAWSAKDGRKIYTILSPKGLFDGEGNFSGSLAVLTDITARRQLEEELHKAQLKAKSKMEKLLAERTAELMKANEQLQHEIAERKRAEDALRESEIRYRSLFDHMGDGVAIYEAVNGGEDFIFVDFNKAGVRADKIKKEAVVGKSVTDVFPRVKDFGLFEVFQRVWKTGRPAYHPIEKYKDERIEEWRENFVYKLPTGELVAVFSDETARKQAEDSLRKSEATVRALLNAPNELVMLLDRKGFFLEVNQATARRFNRSVDEIIGLTPSDLLEPEVAERRKGAVDKVIETAKPFQFEDERLGSWWDTIVYPVLDSAGNVARIAVVARDITERKQTEERIRRLSQEVIKAQDVEKQRLAADLHDHLAQDLACLKVALDTLYADQGDTEDERRQKVTELSRLLEHTLMAVRDKAYGLHPPSLKEFGLAYTVQQYCEEFARKNSLEVDFFSVGMDDLELDFDTEIAFYRLVQEGLTNIRKHANASQVNVRLSASFSHIMLHIEDNGKGFEVNNRLATALNERRMGIWSMEQRVAFLNGKMKIESDPMYGTKILIKVPHREETNG